MEGMIAVEPEVEDDDIIHSRACFSVAKSRLVFIVRGIHHFCSYIINKLIACENVVYALIAYAYILRQNSV